MYLMIIIKTIILYFIMIASYRMIGKKEVGNLSIIDMVVFLLIAELAVLPIEETSYSLMKSIVPIAVLVILQISVHYLTLHNKKLRNLIERKPVVIIKNGKLNFKEMTSLRYSLDNLLLELREQGYRSIEEINYAVLESNGKLSIFKDNHNYPLPLILDGVVDFDVVSEIGKDKTWVMEVLKKKNIPLEEVFYAFYTNHKVYIIKKERA